VAADDDRLGVIGRICGEHGNDARRLLDILHAVHEQWGHVSVQAVDALATSLGIPRVEVQAALSFYGFFSREPRGKFVIRLCDDIIDRHAGAARIARAFEEELGIGFGQTTPDGWFTLAWTPFIGMSDQAPAALVNDKVVTELSTDFARAIVRTLRETGELRALKHALGDGNNGHPLVRSMVRNNLRQRGPVVFEPMEPGRAIRRALGESPIEVIRNVKTARLRGRGGAGFPTGMKWEFARNATGERRFVVCNADEGEPGTFKDRVILTEAPELLVEGMTIAGYAVGASSGIIYLRAEYAYLRRFLESVLEGRRRAGLLGRDVAGHSGFDFDIRIQTGAGAYICGEETALLSSCEGTRGDPRNRPPFPAQHGLHGQPTVVNNVETLCCAARIVERGAAWFSSMGTPDSTGTKLYSVSGDCERPGVYELPFGVKLGELLDMVVADDPALVQVGGASGRAVGPPQFGDKLGFDHLATGGSIMVFNRERDPLEVILAFLDFFCHESCGYCVPCRVGNRLMRERVAKIAAGRGQSADMRYLYDLCKTVKSASRCGLGQSAPNPVLSSMDTFKGEYERRLSYDESSLSPTFDPRRALLDHEKLAQRASLLFGQTGGTP
jgi:[NiFe] hydrogenase diaphorase moiety large subunit